MNNKNNSDYNNDSDVSTERQIYKMKRTARELRKKKTGIGAIIGTLLIVIYSIFSYIRTGTIMPTPELFDSRPTFTFIDVGQGDCILVTYKGEAVLVDAGPASSGKTAAEYVRTYSPSVDYFIITHPHEDHMGGAADILEKVYVDTFVISEVDTDESFYSDALRAASSGGGNIMYVSDETFLDTGNIQIALYDVFDGFDETNLNNTSLIVEITAGSTSLLITGDAEKELERYAIDNVGSVLDCDILKVGHHGSRTSTTEELLKITTPDIAVISCGEDNRYGHPTSEVLERLSEYGIEVRRTDMEGTVVIRGEK